MLKINHLAVVVAAMAAFVLSSGWYVLFSKEMKKLHVMADMKKAPTWKKLVVFVQSLVVAFVFAHLLALGGIVGWVSAAQLGVWVGIGFPVMILTGSVIWENVPWKLAAIHAGDWLLKLLLMAVILGVWR
jgi:Protein of unknown function (DUF1761)